MKINVLLALAWLLLCFFTVSSGRAQTATDPQTVADHCIAKATDIADRTLAANETAVERTLERIAKLLEDEKPRQALVVAHEAIEKLNRRSYVAVQNIDRHCDRCMQVLIRMGEPDLAREVGQACREQAQRIGDSRESSVQAIRDALPEPPPSTEP